MIPFPDKKYSVIYADPPWSYTAGGKQRNVRRHYHTMAPEDIFALPVQDIAADNCLLFLWATFPNLDVALETIRRWGFKYKTAAFVWVKRNRKSPGLFWGISDIVQRAHENAVKHGFWDPAPEFGTAIALIHSELSEALEERRAGRPDLYFPCNAGGVCVDDIEDPGLTCGSRVTDPEHPGTCSAKSKKPEGVAVELADAVIRIADLCGHLGIDLEAVIALKMDYNETRPFKHGKRF